MGKSINDLNPSVEPNVKINTEQNELETSLEQAYSQQGLVESNEQSGIEATNTAGYSRAQSTAYNVLSSASLNDVLTSMEEDEENIEHARFSIYPRNNVPKAIKATPIYKFTTEMLLMVGTMLQPLLYKRVWMCLVLISMTPN